MSVDKDSQPQQINSIRLPYGRHSLAEDDIASVVDVLRSGWLTTGPTVESFEQTLKEFTGSKEAVVVSSGTAALHAAMSALNIGPGDEVIVPAITFVATANAIVYQGGTPIFADVDPNTILIDLTCVEEKISPKTKAIIAVDYGGQPCDYGGLRTIANHHGLALVADACHSLGATYKGAPIGRLADITVFSFHPVKAITTGEGGAIVTDNPELAERARLFRNHGISLTYKQREATGTFHYDVNQLGFNYRLSDIHCALGISQLKKLSEYINRRNLIAKRYSELLSNLPEVNVLKLCDNCTHAFHLFVIKLVNSIDAKREEVFTEMRRNGIGVNVHYLPVYLHSFYRQRFGYTKGLCPVAEDTYDRIISLPIFPAMKTADVHLVVECLRHSLN